MALGAATSVAQAFPVQVAEAPSTVQSLTVGALRSAKRSLHLNIYELTSPEIAEALEERIRAGVAVVILQEGQPVGGMSKAGRAVQARLVKAMRSSRASQSRLLEMNSKTGAKRRFRFNHGKYAIIDGRNLLIGSENYSPTGQPNPGAKGNRGWEVFLHDRTVAGDYEEVFRADTNQEAGDIFDLTKLGVSCHPAVEGCVSEPYSLLTAWLGPWATDAPASAEPSAGLVQGREVSGFGGLSGSDEDGIQQEPQVWPRRFAETAREPFAPWSEPQELEAADATRITSPDSSQAGLIALLNGADRSIDLEQMAFAPLWEQNETASPMLAAVIAAARRGVKVRVLLNNEAVFDRPGAKPGPHKNHVMVKFLNQLAKTENLPLAGRIADIQGMGITYIHNKGALVDGHQTLISSINWNENSVTRNREGAVLIESREVNEHYRRLFDSDWARSASGQFLK